MAELAVVCPAGADGPAGALKSGDYKISWDGPDGSTFELREIVADGAPRVLYRGEQHATTITGRYQGDYAYQVGLVEEGSVSRWSEPCRVLVRPYPLSLALVFFGFGLVVTLATVTLILRGHRAHKRGAIG